MPVKTAVSATTGRLQVADFEQGAGELAAVEGRAEGVRGAFEGEEGEAAGAAAGVDQARPTRAMASSGWVMPRRSGCSAGRGG
jgi:hypothetical protein